MAKQIWTREEIADALHEAVTAEYVKATPSESGSRLKGVDALINARDLLGLNIEDMRAACGRADAQLAGKGDN